MSDITYNELEKGDTVYFARILPRIKIYEVLNLNIVTIIDTYCTGVNPKNNQTYVFPKKYAEEVLFKNRRLALEYLDSKLNENIGDDK